MNNLVLRLSLALLLASPAVAQDAETRDQRVEGSMSDRGDAGLNVIAADDLKDGAEKIVKAARG